MTPLFFRAWHKTERRMYEWDGQYFQCVNADGSFTMFTMGYAVDHPEEFAVMQLTGRKCKNGNEIFEGDIVATKDLFTHRKVYEIAFFRGCFIRTRTSNRGVLRVEHMCSIAEINNNPRYEILGNIYQHPQLLNS